MRFEGAVYRPSHIVHSSLHHGLGWGIHILESENVKFEENIFFDFVKFGINIGTSKNITFDGNWIINIKKRDWVAPGLIDKLAGFVACGYLYHDVCEDIKVVNNILAGTEFYGFVMPGHDCDDKDSETFRNNIQHSTNG